MDNKLFDNKLIVIINGQAFIEYDRSKRLPGHQRQFLDKMDLDMDAGISLMDQEIDEPDTVQRAQFIAVHLVMAALDGNDGKISAMCAYLATRLPDLKQIKANEKNGEYELDLVFDQEYRNQVAVSFQSKLN